MTPRSIRRAAERKAQKLARKAARQDEKLQTNDSADQTAEAEPRASARVLSIQPTMIAAPAADPREFAPITPAQLAANRANAQLSTGPRTAAGKANSSRNAVKSALTGRTVLLPTDDVDEYAAFITGFQHDLAPVGHAECELVQSIADSYWRQRRISALEFTLYAHGHEQFEEAFANHPEEIRYNMILLQTHMTYEKQFRNYQIQEARLQRRREKDMAELRRLQAERKANPAEEEDFSDLDALFAPKAAASQTKASVQLTSNGFDFSDVASFPLPGLLSDPNGPLTRLETASS